MIRNWCFAFGVLMAAVAQAADDSSTSLVESHLTEGRITAAAKALTTQIRADPSNAEAQYGLGVVPNDQKRFPIGFDAADVHWMIGYTHLLRAMTEAWLAYDTEGFFGQTAHFFFSGVESPYQGLGIGRSERGFNMDQIADAVAAIHLVHFQPADPKRLSLAREHLLAMIDQSRLCWEHALAENDDDREWIPNANQTSLTPLTVNDERIVAWKRFLDEADAVLRGDKLLPHWRVKDGRGINLKRVFEEPRTFDLVLWAHGAAAVPYLEEGELVTPETARSLSAAFQGRFLAFAVWFQ